jgi:glycosyltransferase involved in cell wall biosynthesis
MSEQSIFTELSLFTPNFNHGRFLEQKLRQIVDAPVRPREYLIIDDCSTDNSWQIINDFCKEYSWIHSIKNKKNRGNHYNLDLALEFCSGKIFYSSAADDLTCQTAFFKIQKMFKTFPSSGIFFGPMHVIDEKGKQINTITPVGLSKTQFIPPSAFFDLYISKQGPRFSLGTSTYYNKDALLEIGGYPHQARSWQDTLAIWLVGMQFGGCYLENPLSSWRLLPNSNSHNFNKDIPKLVESAFYAKKHLDSKVNFYNFPKGFSKDWAKAYITEAIDAAVLNCRQNHSESIGKIVNEMKITIEKFFPRNFIRENELYKIVEGKSVDAN